ncbi:MAG: bifunctional 23S rRNA (guanine(2069)-N(7))-methyltransferase RlmK/23S rRNA (guanine(2445)-N(2))-methyltransferase RlmL [Wenzhouxiangellaceae bacterium]|nr:bifunctional 23S rRNA (guanine(2069)-N(7))-methyltransferase RlmK/23S rRNA (guanine(2445)-N(2))-methyltransferase RlmL [Wenzhouxiangellaceae bacterium]
MIEFIATAPRGLEELLAAELGGLGLDTRVRGPGAVVFEGRLPDAYRACLWSRVANRVLLPLAAFEADDGDALYAGAGTIDWTEHLDPGRTLAVSCTGQRPAITHGRYAEQRVKDAVVDQLRTASGERPSVDTRSPDARLHLHLAGSRAELALDLAGDSLHRRGYREPGTRAPLKENLAAAMLLRAGWPGIASAGGALCDPMTGSGTLPIEAAWIAGDVAPGLNRTRFGFLRWRGHDDAAWKDLVDEAIEREQAGRARIPVIIGHDRDPAAIKVARANVERAGLTGKVRIECSELGTLRAPDGLEHGLVAVNPPYGERLASTPELLPLYLQLGRVLKTGFPGWRAIVLNGAGCELGLKPERSWQMDNGPIRCRLERFELAAASPGYDTAADDSPAAMPAPDLVNRIRKNQRQLRKWLAREAISCYRVYDADIPEYALAVDVYGSEQGDWLHVQEYAPPKQVDERAARTRLRDALAALPDALDIDPARLVFKVRERQRGAQQYRQLGHRGEFLTVNEAGCRLLVNLTDHLDTGLFLDHRPLRRWLQENARGKRFLNLFCYTGAATVHAARGGARNTTSIDLSNTYLDWLQRNLALNGLDDGHQRVIRADVLDWLQRADERFELIFLDPPSFSNSKKMDGALDLQRDHADLIDQAMRLLARGGVLVFSTNRKRFALDPALSERYAIDDRSAWSIPRDFARNRSIHRCYFIRHREASAPTEDHPT